MSRNNEAQASAAKEGRSFFRGLFGRVKHEVTERESRSGGGSGNPLDLGDI